MKVEYSPEKQNNTKKRKKKSRKKALRLFFLWLIILIFGTVSTLSLTIWFKIKNFAINPNEFYSYEQIINATGISIDDNLILISANKAETRIETNLPYVKKAEVKRKFPDTVVINATAAEEYAVVEISDILYIVDEDFKVLKSVTEVQDGLPIIKGISSVDVKVGSILTFEEQTQNQVLKELTGLTSSYLMNVTAINIDNLLDITFILENRMYVQLGSYNNIYEKIVHLNSMLPTIEKEASVKISLALWSPDNKKTTLVYEDISSYR